MKLRIARKIRRDDHRNPRYNRWQHRRARQRWVKSPERARYIAIVREIGRAVFGEDLYHHLTPKESP